MHGLLQLSLLRKRMGQHGFVSIFGSPMRSLGRMPSHCLVLMITLGQACLFSTLDLASGYWQVQVDPKDQEKTAFVTPLVYINLG